MNEIMMMMIMTMIIIIIINKDRTAAIMYPLGTLFVSRICVWIPCIQETMMMMMIIIIIIVIISQNQIFLTLCVHHILHVHRQYKAFV
jgi:hypothetical protein